MGLTSSWGSKMATVARIAANTHTQRGPSFLGLENSCSAENDCSELEIWHAERGPPLPWARKWLLF